MNDNNNIVNTLFDTSSLEIKNLTEKEFSEENQRLLTNILQHVFKNEPLKQSIKQTPVGYNFACPFCRDSATNPRKKRGNLIIRGQWAGTYKCFNCGKTLKISNFFKEFNENISLSYINYMSNNIKSTYSDTNYMQSNIISDIFNTEEIMKYAVDREKLKSMFNFMEIEDNVNAYAGYNYLIKRCQYNFNNFLYDSHGYIIILNLIKGKVIGFQTRDITGKRPKEYRYQTFNTKRIYKDIFKSDIEIPANVNSLSTVFNIFNIDMNMPILVTEGPFDAFLLPNCIATSGATKSLGVDFPLWYVYDSDKTGEEKAMEKLKEGNNVFMWKKLKEDLNLPYKKKWDINDVIIWCKENKHYERIYWSKYFSNNALDGLDI